MSAWTDHVAKWKDCTACPLSKQRFRICLARGAVPADILFIGEAPGASEDATGKSFWGPAGDLLQKIIDRAIPTSVSYALTNLVCCFPREAKKRGDNEPERAEILSCRPRLIEFVNVVQPKLIVCVGAIAAEYVPRREGVIYTEIVHPAAILRTPIAHKSTGMPLAQKQMAIQKTIVVLRRAVEDIAVQSNGQPFAKWEESHANIKSKGSGERIRDDYDQWAGDPAAIPF